MFAASFVQVDNILCIRSTKHGATVFTEPSYFFRLLLSGYTVGWKGMSYNFSFCPVFKGKNNISLQSTLTDGRVCLQKFNKTIFIKLSFEWSEMKQISCLRLQPNSLVTRTFYKLFPSSSPWPKPFTKRSTFLTLRFFDRKLQRKEK